MDKTQDLFALLLRQHLTYHNGYVLIGGVEQQVCLLKKDSTVTGKP